MKPIYEMFNQIYCINLISRPDRYELMQKFEEEEGIKLKYYRPKKNVISGRLGCFTSHIKCVQDAYLMNYPLVLIFEDDVVKTKFYNKIDWKQIKEFIEKDNTWEILKFSSTTNPIDMVKPNEYKYLYNGPTLMGTSYALNRKGIEKIMKTFGSYIQTNHLDEYYYKIFPKTTFNVIPIPFDQRWDMGSDNEWEWTLSRKNQEYVRNILNYNVFYYTSLIKFYNLIIYLLIIFIFGIYIFKKTKR